MNTNKQKDINPVPTFSNTNNQILDFFKLKFSFPDNHPFMGTDKGRERDSIGAVAI